MAIEIWGFGFEENDDNRESKIEVEIEIEWERGSTGEEGSGFVALSLKTIFESAIYVKHKLKLPFLAISRMIFWFGDDF